MKKGNDKRKATEEKIHTVGPWGGNEGNEFDDGTFSGIREIKIGYGDYIYSITVVYDQDGNPTEPYIHGPVNQDWFPVAEVSSIGLKFF